MTGRAGDAVMLTRNPSGVTSVAPDAVNTVARPELMIWTAKLARPTGSVSRTEVAVG
jgi:hypothetical protein